MPHPNSLPIQQYLNMTKDLHNGLAFADFTNRISLKVSTSRMAEDFNVSRVTIYTWLNKYKKETGAQDAKGDTPID